MKLPTLKTCSTPIKFPLNHTYLNFLQVHFFFSNKALASSWGGGLDQKKQNTNKIHKNLNKMKFKVYNGAKDCTIQQFTT
jgi:hypothetical protein